MTEVPRNEFDVHAFITENDELEVFKFSTVYRGVAAGLVEKAYLVGKAVAERDVDRIESLERQLNELRAEVKEWVCAECMTVYPGPPQSGFKCVMCPKCNGRAMPRHRFEILSLRKEIERIRSQYKGE